MRRMLAVAFGLPLFLRASSALAAPHANPESAVVHVLQEMRSRLRYAPDVPAPRGPHAWSARQVLAAGTVNGCVESAKAFFTLFRAAYPRLHEVYIDSFDSIADGGHAVVEVTGSDGRPFIVDATAFERMPGPPRVTDDELSRPIDIARDRMGRIIQLKDRADLLVEKEGAGSSLAEYPYARVFHAPPRSARRFATLEQLNSALAAFAQPAKADFRYLKEHGLILPFADAKRDSFLYEGASGLSLHVIYGCYADLPAVDEAERIEPRARKNYRLTGRAGTCRVKR